MTGTKEHPKDIFGGALEEGDTIAFIKYGRMNQGIITGFTAFGARLVDADGVSQGNVLRDRIVGPQSLSRA